MHWKLPLILLGLAVIIFLGLQFGKPFWDEHVVQSTSDIKDLKGTMTVAMDSWIGYFPLCSLEMREQMKKDKWLLRCEDDKADYAKRMEKLSHGKTDFAVATVDSYLLNDKAYNYDGVIILVIDESKGGDAIVANAKIVPNLDVLKANTQVKFAGTPGSPSHHLIKTVAKHFGMSELLTKGRMVETARSEEAWEKLQDGDVDVAVLWEPDVSRALNKGFVKLIGTEDMEGVIVDILVANRSFLANHPDAVELLLKNYFDVLQYYRDNPDALVKNVKQETDVSEDDVAKAMLAGVHFSTLTENVEKWFNAAAATSVTVSALVKSIESAVDILVESKDFSASPLPGNDPYRLIASAPIAAAFEAAGGVLDAGEITDPLTAPFKALSGDGWGKLRRVGAVKVDPIIFQSGTANLTLEGKEIIDRMVETLEHYPRYRISIEGHTGTRGDPAVNLQLSQERAESVQRYLEVTYSVDANRMRAMGHGGTKPMKKPAGEEDDAYQKYRLPRVEILFMADPL
ncbi:MAG: OmpA family protein [Candidatus Niyogibacteria bacterium]|nr:OmpA family protein [Candidatus Niyogibacteria bacterium]